MKKIIAILALGTAIAVSNAAVAQDVHVRLEQQQVVADEDVGGGAGVEGRAHPLALARRSAAPPAAWLRTPWRVT